VLPSLDRIRLDLDLDFIVHNDGVIELTEAGFRRMVQAHSAGLDAVIGVCAYRRLSSDRIRALPVAGKQSSPDALSLSRLTFDALNR
jgi:hypothetical protein